MLPRLQEIEVFADLGEKALQDLQWTLRPFSRVAGETLIREGDPATAMYALTSGSVSVSVQLGKGRSLDLYTVGAGGVVGEMALIDGGPRSASVTAIDSVEGVVMLRGPFEALCNGYHPSACKLLRRIAGLVSERLECIDLAGAHPDAPEWEIAATDLQQFRKPCDETVAQALARQPVFARFSPEELATLQPALNILDLPREQFVYREASPASHCYLVLRGAVEVSRPGGTVEGSESRGRYRLGLYEPGRLFGERAVFGSSRHSVDAVTREPSTLVEIPVDQIDRHFQEESELAFKFSVAACAQMVESLRRLNRRKAWLLSGAVGPGGRRSGANPPQPRPADGGGAGGP